LDIDAAGIVPMADDEVFVLIADSDYYYISNYGRCAVKTDLSFQLVSRVPCREYRIQIEEFEFNKPKMISKMLQTERLVVEAFIVNYDVKYSDSVFHLGDDQDDFYYKHLFPVTKKQYREL